MNIGFQSDFVKVKYKVWVDGILQNNPIITSMNFVKRLNPEVQTFWIVCFFSLSSTCLAILWKRLKVKEAPPQTIWLLVEIPQRQQILWGFRVIFSIPPFLTQFQFSLYSSTKRLKLSSSSLICACYLYVIYAFCFNCQSIIMLTLNMLKIYEGGGAIWFSSLVLRFIKIAILVQLKLLKNKIAFQCGGRVTTTD